MAQVRRLAPAGSSHQESLGDRYDIDDHFRRVASERTSISSPSAGSASPPLAGSAITSCQPDASDGSSIAGVRSWFASLAAPRLRGAIQLCPGRGANDPSTAKGWNLAALARAYLTGAWPEAAIYLECSRRFILGKQLAAVSPTAPAGHGINALRGLAPLPCAPVSSPSPGLGRSRSAVAIATGSSSCGDHRDAPGSWQGRAIDPRTQ